MSQPRTYAEDDYWRRYLPFLPEVMRLPQDPIEEWWTWRGTQVHLDRLDAENAPLKVIVLHGGGGTGRLVSAFGETVPDQVRINGHRTNQPASAYEVVIRLLSSE